MSEQDQAVAGEASGAAIETEAQSAEARAANAAANAGGRGGRQNRAIFSVPVQVVVSVGNARPTIGELLSMKRDTLLQLDSKLDDPVEIMVGKRVVARGELQEIELGDARLGAGLTVSVYLCLPF